LAVKDAGKGASGTVNHLELWIDRSKIDNDSGSTMNSANTTPAYGSHTAQVVEVESKGACLKSAPMTFAVQSANGCPAPRSAGVDIGTPTLGETTSSTIATAARRLKQM
jgi:hypothetical protein